MRGNLIIVASPDGGVCLIKIKALMKPYVEHFGKRPMFEERCWGDYKVLDYRKYHDAKYSLTKYIYVRENECISYQSHKLREEIWTIVDGRGLLVLEGETWEVCRGDVIHIFQEQKHAILAVQNLHIIEVQIGVEVSETDIKRFD